MRAEPPRLGVDHANNNFVNEHSRIAATAAAPNRWVLWTGRILLGLLALIVLLAASGATYEAIMRAGDAKRYPPPGQLVDVGGHRLHLHCVGQGSPTVVLDAGLGAFSLDWGASSPRLPRPPAFARTTGPASAGANLARGRGARSSLPTSCTRC